MRKWCANGHEYDGDSYLEPIGRDDALVEVCERCAKSPASGRGSKYRPYSTPMPERNRNLRQQYILDGICKNAKSHGKATHGQLCTACYRRQRAYFKARRERLRKEAA